MPASRSPKAPVTVADPAFDRAWAVSIGGGICSAVSQGVIILYCFGMFVPIIAEEFNTSPGLIGASVSPAIICMSVLFPVVGHFIDRYGARRIGFVAFPLFALAVAALGLAYNSITFMLLLLVASLIGTPTNPTSWVPTVSQWFSTRRGLGLGLFTTVTGLGVMLAPLLAGWLITEFGWRLAYVGLAIVSGVVGLGALLFLVRDPPRPPKEASSVEATLGERDAGTTLGRALRGYPLYAMFAAFLLFGAATGTVAIHTPAYLSTLGGDLGQAGVAMGLFGLAGLVGRMSIGFVLDRVFAPWVSMALFILPAIGFAILLASPSYNSVLILMILAGFGLGGELADVGYITGAAFGRREHAKLVGLLMFAYAAGQGTGPGIVGLLMNSTGSYEIGFIVMIGFALTASILMMSLRAAHMPYYPTARYRRLVPRSISARET